MVGIGRILDLIWKFGKKTCRWTILECEKKEKNPWWLLGFWENNDDIYWDGDDEENVVYMYTCV